MPSGKGGGRWERSAWIYYWNKENHPVQIRWFERQLELAREEGLPVIIHSREAAADTLEVMKRMKAGEIGGVMHCFSYSRELAREYLDMGLYLGIGGVLTFKNARKLKEVVEYAPLSRLLLETDCPYLAPVPNRGKTEFIAESAVCGGGDCRSEGHFT